MFNPSICLQCQSPLVGRSDKKFCDIQCKALYNNEKSRARDAYPKHVNSRLRKNRSILKHLSPEGKTTIRMSELESRSFDFHIFTNVWKSKSGVYFFSYDWGFMPIIDSSGIPKAIIVKKQDYMTFEAFDPWAKIKANN